MRGVFLALLVLLASAASVSALTHGFAQRDLIFASADNDDHQTNNGLLLHTRDAPAFDTGMYSSQLLDHFDAVLGGNRTYTQRYYRSTQFCPASGACTAAVIYVGGEAALTAASMAKGQHITIAQQHEAVIYGLEHRYYGISVPFMQLTTENLQFLSSQQALADLAQFITDVVLVDHPQAAGRIITVGGSYPGALSEWARLKYPHLVRAALASSGPVRAEADFYEYDLHVSQSAGDDCAAALHEATVEVENRLATPASAAQVKALFSCQEVPNDDSFLYVIADVVAFAIQYTSTNQKSGYRYHMRERLCNSILTAKQQGGIAAQVEAYANFTNSIFQARNEPATTWDLMADQYKQTSWTEDSNMRQWMYQSCTEFGYFQTAPQPPNKPLRSTRLTLQYFYDVCQYLYDMPLIPNTAFTNAYYGSQYMQASRVVATSGSVDPWTRLCFTSAMDCCPTEIPIVIDGTSHCADLADPSPDDPKSLTDARSRTQSLLSTWMDNDCLDVCRTTPPACNSVLNNAGVAVGIGFAVLAVGGVIGVFLGIWIAGRCRRKREGDFAPLNSDRRI